MTYQYHNVHVNHVIEVKSADTIIGDCDCMTGQWLKRGRGEGLAKKFQTSILHNFGLICLIFCIPDF